MSFVIRRNASIQAAKPKTLAEWWIDGITLGWNLGNTLDSTGNVVDKIGTPQEVEHYETMWGNPMTTEAMFDKVKEAGFNMIRIPVTWAHHLDNHFQISPLWLERVVELVDWAIARGMRVLINTHHDHSNYGPRMWLTCDIDKAEETAANLHTVWTQIANRFKEHSLLLAFEGFNEIMTSPRTWMPATEAEYAVCNRLNQTFVDAVRATGSHNVNRVLSINTYAASLQSMEYFRMPDDMEPGQLFAQYHGYNNTTNQELESQLTVVDTWWRSKGIPVLSGEFGSTTAMNYDMRVTHARNYTSRLKAHGIAAALWDVKYDYQMLDRDKVDWMYPEIVEALMKGLKHHPVYDHYLRIEQFNRIDQFNWGALDDESGESAPFAMGAIHLKEKLSVTPGYQYRFYIGPTNRGYRFPRLFWYDGNGDYIGYTHYGFWGVIETTVQAPYNAHYVNFYATNPWNTYPQSVFQAELSNNLTYIEIKEVAKPPDASERLYAETIDLSDSSNWQRGVFEPSSGRFREDPSLICTGYIECNPSQEFKFRISNSNIGLVVSEMDIHKNIVYGRVHISDGMYLPVSNRTKYLVLTMYNLTRDDTSYEYFQQLFNDGLTIEMVNETNINLDENGSLDLVNLDLTDISNYKSGRFVSGEYSNPWWVHHYMCIYHPIKINSLSAYTVTLPAAFAINVQELSANKTVIRNSFVQNNGMFTTTSTASYILVNLEFYRPAQYVTDRFRSFKDFWNALSNDEGFVFAIASSPAKAITLRIADGHRGYALNNQGQPYSIGSNDYYCFSSIDVSALNSREIQLYNSTGGLFLCQYGVNGALLKTQWPASNQNLLLEEGTTRIRFVNTWMNSGSTIVFSYNADQEINYVKQGVFE